MKYTDKMKTDDLAVFGGKPAFTEPRHVGAPNVGNREDLFERLNTMLDRNRLTNRGPFVRELESKLADYLGVKHVIAMCNGTVALEIAIRALDLKGEVIIPAMTFIATAHALQWQEIRPVFADIDAHTHHLDPARIEEMITPNTSGIIGVHLWGRPGDVTALQEIARRNQLKLMFDAAHAFGASYNGQMIGGFGDAEVFSFHATKIFNTFEGGAVATNNDELAEKIRLMQNFGFVGKDRVIYIGTNGKMNEVSAAMGLTSLDGLEEFKNINRQNYGHYARLLKRIPGVRLLPYDDYEHNNHQYIVLEINEKVTGISRDQIMRMLHAENVIARRYFYPGCHRMEPYRSYQPHAGLLLPNTERILQQVLTLPTGSAIDEYQIKAITQIIKFSFERAAEIRNRWPVSVETPDFEAADISDNTERVAV